MAKRWAGDDNRNAWWDEPASLFASTAPFCESAVEWARADGASLALLFESPNRRELVFASDVLAQRIDELQFAVGEGPCLASYATGRPQCIIDLAHDHRWTAFSREVVALGVGAHFSFPVSIGAHPVGVLELYRRDAGVLTVDEYDATLGCAAAIGAVMGAACARWSHRVPDGGNLDNAALAAMAEHDPFSRSDVLSAGEVIAEHLRIPIGEALLRMRAYAFARNLRITAVADDIINQEICWADWCDGPPDDG